MAHSSWKLISAHKELSILLLFRKPVLYLSLGLDSSVLRHSFFRKICFFVNIFLISFFTSKFHNLGFTLTVRRWMQPVSLAQAECSRHLVHPHRASGFRRGHAHFDSMGFDFHFPLSARRELAWLASFLRSSLCCQILCTVRSSGFRINWTPLARLMCADIFRLRVCPALCLGSGSCLDGADAWLVLCVSRGASASG